MRKLFFALTAFLIAVLMIVSPVCALGEPTSIYIDSNVYAAEVYVDGGFVGNTPYSYGTYLNGESHRITVSEWGYESYTTTAYAGESVYATLTKLPSDIGYISVGSSPSGADIYIDNIYLGTTPMSSSFSTGSHSVQINLNGYSPYYETAYVNPDSTTNVYASFYNPNPTPIPGDYGYISVTSWPSGLEFYIDGNYEGITPLTVTVSSGSHSVHVNYQNYAPYIEDIYVNSGSTANVYAQFSPVPPIPTQSPVPFIAFIAGLGAVALFALRRE